MGRPRTSARAIHTALLWQHHPPHPSTPTHPFPLRTCCTASISAGSFSRSLGAPMRTMTARRPGVFSGLSVAMRATSSEGSILSLTCTE